MQKKKFKFTNASIKALPANPVESKSTECEYADTEIIGLKCLSGKSGNKRWMLRYTMEGRKHAITLGRFPDLDVTAARNIAKKHKVQIAEGINPKTKRDGYLGMPTVGDFFHQTYLPLAQKRKKSWKDDVQRFKSFCGGIALIPYDKLKAIDVQDIQNQMMIEIDGESKYKPATCNRVIALIKTIGSPNSDNKCTTHG